KLVDMEVGKTIKTASGRKTYEQSIYAGMVRFQANPNVKRKNFMMNPEAQKLLGKDFNLGKFTGHNKTGSMRNHSLYYTFRIMHEDSQGWIHPGLKPM